LLENTAGVTSNKQGERNESFDSLLAERLRRKKDRVPRREEGDYLNDMDIKRTYKGKGSLTKKELLRYREEHPHSGKRGGKRGRILPGAGTGELGAQRRRRGGE